MVTKPRKIVVEIDEDAYQELVHEIGTKRALDNIDYFSDEFILVLVKALYVGKSHIHVTKRKKGRRTVV